MYIAGLSQANLFNPINSYQPLNQSQDSVITHTSLQPNPSKTMWPQKLQHTRNTSNEFSKEKWDRFSVLKDALIKTNYCQHFANDHITYQNILKCQQKLREIDFDIVKKITAPLDDESASNHITPELKAEIEEIGKTADLFFITLSDIRKSDRIIHGDTSQKCFFSRRMTVGIALTIVGMALAATAFVLPIAIPALVISAPALLVALRGLGLLVSCTDGSLNIRDAINKCYQKSKKMESIEFTDAFSKLYDYLNEIKFIGKISLAARNAESLNGCNELLPDTSEQKESIQREFTRQLQIAIQPLRAEIETLRQLLSMQSQMVTPIPDQTSYLSHCP